jgi:XapX domain-containing protein
MKEMLLALLAGVVVGGLFKLIKLPLPAPPVLSGVLGIVGIYLGGLLTQRLMEWLK